MSDRVVQLRSLGVDLRIRLAPRTTNPSPAAPRTELPLPRPFGKYELQEKIGAGGMAEVFRAKMPGVAGFEKTVVIKRILPHLSHDKAIDGMFVAEAKIAARVQHRNVVQVFDLGEVAGELYMAMEHIAGTDLSALLRSSVKRKIQLPIWFSLHLISEVLSGLAAAHDLRNEQGVRLNVVHRDVSPSNIFLSYQGDIKLGDFGVAISDDRTALTRAGELKGKVAYMAPEQLYHQPLDERADVFAAGIVLWECLTQRRLFGGRPEIEMMNAICRDSRPLPSKINPGVPPELDAVVIAALRPDREQRTPSAAELQRQLAAILPLFAAQIVPSDVRNVVEAVLGQAETTGARLKEPSIPARSVSSSGASFLDPTPRSAEKQPPPSPVEPDVPEIEINFVETVEPEKPAFMRESWLLGQTDGPRVLVVADREAQRRAETPPWQTAGHVTLKKDGRQLVHDGGYRGPRPFWLQNEDDMLWGPCDYTTIRRYLSSDLERRSHNFRVAAYETAWVDLDVFAALTGQEILMRPVELPEKSKLTGSLKTRSLSSVLAAIWAVRATGRLLIAGEGQQHPPRRELHFLEGVPIYAATDAPKLQLPDMLLRQGMIREEDLAAVMHEVLYRLEPIEEAASRYSPLQVEQNFSLFMRERAAEIFTWRKGLFAFEADFTGRKGRPFARTSLQLALTCAARVFSEPDLRERTSPFADRQLAPSERLGPFFKDAGFTEEQGHIARRLCEGATLRSLQERKTADERLLMLVTYLLVELGMVNVQL